MSLTDIDRSYIQKIYNSLGDDPLDVKTISALSHFTEMQVRLALSFLESQGKALRILKGNKRYFVKLHIKERCGRGEYKAPPLPLRYTPREEPYISMVSKVHPNIK